ncbi:hypothetical protein MHBO_002163 [Bonamia ostreae]|uniref:Uncharacterized protein n=1 Tax=Bonamia ostreae TaxID=126728 RepID=A0ABV2AMG2_9EUKA
MTEIDKILNEKNNEKIFQKPKFKNINSEQEKFVSQLFSESEADPRDFAALQTLNEQKDISNNEDFEVGEIDKNIKAKIKKDDCSTKNKDTSINRKDIVAKENDRSKEKSGQKIENSTKFVKKTNLKRKAMNKTIVAKREFKTGKICSAEKILDFSQLKMNDISAMMNKMDDFVKKEMTSSFDKFINGLHKCYQNFGFDCQRKIKTVLKLKEKIEETEDKISKVKNLFEKMA